MTIGQLEKKFSKIDIRTVLADSLKTLQPELANAQRLQMRSGLNREGKLIGRYRNAVYARKKHELNPIPGLGNVDLYLTGKMQSEIFVDVRSSGSIVFASADNEPTDSGVGKFDSLVDKYGNKITGLSKDTIAVKITPLLSSQFIKSYKSELRKL
ncbi:MAG TPA: hypothetical protein VLF89_03620 [Candidatus Saccharimonadales bacterium]|nr:hypothetical protein [Candidatus Saccharimonadales bacterium]